MQPEKKSNSKSTKNQVKKSSTDREGDCSSPLDPENYCKIASSNTSRLEAHVGFFRLLMKEIFSPYVL